MIANLFNAILPVAEFLEKHPNLTTFTVIMLGFLIMLVWQWGRNVGYRQAQARYYITPILFRPEDKRP